MVVHGVLHEASWARIPPLVHLPGDAGMVLSSWEAQGNQPRQTCKFACLGFGHSWGRVIPIPLCPIFLGGSWSNVLLRSRVLGNTAWTPKVFGTPFRFYVPSSPSGPGLRRVQSRLHCGFVVLVALGLHCVHVALRLPWGCLVVAFVALWCGPLGARCDCIAVAMDTGSCVGRACSRLMSRESC